MSRWLIGFTIAMLLAVPLTSYITIAGAQESQRSAISSETLIEAAHKALAAGKLDDAETLLEGLETNEKTIDEMDFLYGMIAMQREDWPSAIARFRAILIRHPDLPRPRLELARAFFYAGDDKLARHHFELVLASNPPEAVVKNVQGFLDAIRTRRRWDAHFRTRPLSRQQRQYRHGRGNRLALRTALSGYGRIQTLLRVGLIVWGGAEYEYPLTPQARWRAGADLRRQEHRRQEFNRMTLSLHTGPRWIITRNAEISLLASRRQQWAGNKPGYVENGLRLEARNASARTGLPSNERTGTIDATTI